MQLDWAHNLDEFDESHKTNFCLETNRKNKADIVLHAVPWSMGKTSAPQAWAHAYWTNTKAYDSEQTNILTSSHSKYKAMPSLVWVPQFSSLIQETIICILNICTRAMPIPQSGTCLFLASTICISTRCSRYLCTVYVHFDGTTWLANIPSDKISFINRIIK